MPAPIFEEDEEPQSFVEVWTGKIKRSPFLTVGILGFIGCGIYGARSYRSYRATGMSTSIFLVQLRVIAQGAVVGALCLGLLGQAYNDYTQSNTQNKK